MPDREFSAPRGPSILQLVEDKADEAYAVYTSRTKGSTTQVHAHIELTTWCEAVAIIKNPYAPDVSAAKREVVARYESAQRG